MTTLARQSLRFASVGVLNTTVGFSTIVLLMLLLNVSPVLANALGYASGFALSFALNRSWTFESSRNASRDLLRYFLVVAICYAVNLGLVMALTVRHLLNPYAAQALGLAVYTVCSFLAFRFFVFAPRAAS